LIPKNNLPDSLNEEKLINIMDEDFLTQLSWDESSGNSSSTLELNGDLKMKVTHQDHQYIQQATPTSTTSSKVTKKARKSSQDFKQNVKIHPRPIAPSSASASPPLIIQQAQQAVPVMQFIGSRVGELNLF
jgi:hypothetical protein